MDHISLYLGIQTSRESTFCALDSSLLQHILIVLGRCARLDHDIPKHKWLGLAQNHSQHLKDTVHNHIENGYKRTVSKISCCKYRVCKCNCLYILSVKWSA